MPGNRRKVNLPDGRQAEASVVSFQSAGEHWNEYLVDDGTVIRFKAVVTEILKVDGEYDPEGSPMYMVGNANLVVVSAPDHLRKDGGAS
ncbi:MAG: hypothetical protein WAM97_18505 [Acidimicrobiales bacterium]